MQHSRAVALAASLSLVLSAPGVGQSPITSSGSVEVIGLRRWTVSMLSDSLRRVRPDVALGDAACGEVLRDSLGFPDAAVLRFRDGRVVVTVVEPGEAGRIVLLPPPTGPKAPPGPWLRLRELADTNALAVDYAVASYFRHAAGERVSVDAADSAVVHAAWSLLADSSTGSDAEGRAAVAALGHDPDPAVRLAAASYLVRYPSSDWTWHALVRALRDQDWSVRGAANQSLRALREAEPRAVDWRPATVDLRHLLDGTTLVFHTEVVKLLLATSVTRAQSEAIISPDGARLLLDQMGAKHEYLRVPATDLLVLLSGINPESEPARWQRWVQGVTRAPRR